MSESWNLSQILYLLLPWWLISNNDRPHFNFSFRLTFIWRTTCFKNDTLVFLSYFFPTSCSQSSTFSLPLTSFYISSKKFHVPFGYKIAFKIIIVTQLTILSFEIKLCLLPGVLIKCSTYLHYKKVNLKKLVIKKRRQPQSII